jgi:hypothetical protein
LQAGRRIRVHVGDLICHTGHELHESYHKSFRGSFNSAAKSDTQLIKIFRKLKD